MVALHANFLQSNIHNSECTSVWSAFRSRHVWCKYV